MSVISEQDKQSVISVVQEAQECLLDFRRRYIKENYKLKIEEKPDGSFVTEADYASNEIIVSKLKEIFPNDGILSEELPRDPELVEKERLWILDPLDGTTSFIQKKDDFSILLAFSVKGAVHFSAMLFPAKNLTVLAEQGRGVTLNDAPISVSSNEEIRDQGIYTRSCSLRDPNKAYPHKIDSGMALLEVARGGFDAAVIGLDTLKEWDLAAPALVIQESGGTISDDNNQPVSFDAAGINYSHFIASNGRHHSEVLDLLVK